MTGPENKSWLATWTFLHNRKSCSDFEAHWKRPLRPWAVLLRAAIVAEYNAARDPLTEADPRGGRVLRQKLLWEGEGWLSEASPDDFSRLQKSRVWVVDPLDGTREFVAGIQSSASG
jgi:fructose-1,6-bisphosphatase/inositol monophosphatase family enzyme